MSRFFSKKFDALVPYVPGEQPKDMKYVKLNTNESPFPPSEKAVAAAEEAMKRIQLYSDPECAVLVSKLAEVYGVGRDTVICSNGSDEILNFAFMAYCDEDRPAVFPDITYGFYPVFAEFNRVPYKEIPLKDDFMIDLGDYEGEKGTVFIANPNAPTGIAIPREKIEEFVAADPDRIVVVDEAYVDFGAESCVPLTKKYGNLLVCMTFSKSRSMAGARLGFGIGSPDLIRDLNTVRFSTNPYNVNSMTIAAGAGALSDEAYTRRNCALIAENRAYLTAELKKLGFELTDSSANFVFARNPLIGGGDYYRKLKEKGVLVRHFPKPRTADYVRITVGSREQLNVLLEKTKEILGEIK